MLDFKLRCRRCREVVVSSDHIVNTHGEKFNIHQGDPCSSPATNSVWHISTEIEQLPWILAAVNQASWLKGKLTCPKCKGRLGSFDLVNSSQCPCKEKTLSGVHILRDRVDRVGVNAAVPVARVVPRVDRPHGDVSTMYSEASVTFRVNRSVDNSTGPTDDSGINSASRECSDQHSSGRQTSAGSVRDLRQNRLRFRNRGGGGAAPPADAADLVRVLAVNVSQDGDQCTAMDQEQKRTEEAHPGEGVLEEHVCPVCLDVFLNPHRCHPCSHVFCECCLRQLCQRSDNSSSFPCPMCRELIRHCSPEKDLTCTIMRHYPRSYRFRRQFDNKYLSHRYPLPRSSPKSRPETHEGAVASRSDHFLTPVPSTHRHFRVSRVGLKCLFFLTTVTMLLLVLFVTLVV